MRTALGIVLVASCAVAAQRDTSGLKPTPVTLKKDNTTLGDVAAELSKPTNGAAVQVKVEHPETARAKCSVSFDGTPFWAALESVADQTKTKLALRDGGRSVVLEPRATGREVSALAGPFRIVPRTVTGRLLLDQGLSFHEVELDVHWEPRLPVFRIDSHPKITKAVDDRGIALTAEGGGSRHYPTTSLTDMKVRLTGLTRESKQIALLAGEFRATAAETVFAISFKNLAGKFPITETNSGVNVTLKSFEKIGGTWDAQLELTYPEGHPSFESFEEQKWLRDNRLRLVDPNGQPYEPDNDDVIAAGRRVAATYRFKVLANAKPTTDKGWALVCETPGPLMEMKVPFVLKNIPLP